MVDCLAREPEQPQLHAVVGPAIDLQREQHVFLPSPELVGWHAIADARGAGAALGFDGRNQVWPVRIVEHAQNPGDEVPQYSIYLVGVHCRLPM